MIRPGGRKFLLYVFVTQLIAALLVSAIIQPRPGSDGSRWSGSSARRGKSKHKAEAGPTPGFTGGSGLSNNRVVWCESESLPGCQACPDGSRCTACWAQYPNATGSRFVLNPFTGQCDCAPGYGLLPRLPPPTWPSRHLLTAPGQETPPSNDTAASIQATITSTPYADPSSLQNVPPGLFLPDPLPSWSSNCLACPVNYFSPGGQQGFSQCRPCPGRYTTAYATGSSNCLFPYCGPGQEPSRRTGRCRACPIGTYSFANANNQQCYPCPKGYTTAAPGSRNFTECRVPVCAAGTQLDLDLLVCTNCQGNSISAGGSVSQGTAQPRCQECPFGKVADQSRTVCYTGACPYPDNFAISCRTEDLLNTTNYSPCGPGGKPVSINQYCTAYPPGSELAMYQALFDAGPGTNEFRTFLTQDITCPAGANTSNVWYPVIISFNGRTDCVCPTTRKVGCYFVSGSANSVQYAGGTANARTLGPNITIPDPQLTALRNLVLPMAGTNNTVAYSALSTGYCRVQPLTFLIAQSTTNQGQTTIVGVNFTNPLQVNCSGPYITRIALQPSVSNGSWAANGVLPNAATFQGLSQLRMLSCVDCGLDGTLPRDWGTQPSLMELRVLDLSGNTLTGTLPETWGYMVNLAELTLSSLNTTTLGTIPYSWGYMRSLTFVNMTGAYLDNSVGSCAPWQWRINNGLVFNQTLLPPANYPNMSFCPVSSSLG